MYTNQRKENIMNNQKLTWSEVSKQINLTNNLKDLMQLYVDTHQQASNGRTLNYDDFDFLRILFKAKFNELKSIESIHKTRQIIKKWNK